MTSATLRAAIYAPLFRAFACFCIVFAPGARPAAAQNAPQLSGVAFRAVSIAGCQPAILDVGLTRQAPKGGTQVLLTSSTPALSLPTSVVVPKGALLVSVPVTSRTVTAETVATVRATLGSQSMSAQIRLRPLGVAALTFNQSSVMGGDVVRATIALECPAGPGGVTVSVSSDNPRAVGPVVPQITVPAGASSGMVNVVTSGVAATTHQVLTATPLTGGLAGSATLVTNLSTNTGGVACSTDDRPGRTSVVPGITTQAAGRFACKWRRNNLTVAFLNGDDVQRNKVRTIVPEWHATGYVFSFVDDPASADIRVEFDADPTHKDQGWSNVGPCTSTAPARTMLLGVTSNPAEPHRYLILHEFGHALGLVHEHQSPAFEVEWNMAGIKTHYFKGSPTQEDDIRHAITDRRDATNYTAFDPSSIMKYQIYRDMVEHAAEIESRYGAQLFADVPTSLSPMDIQFVTVWRTSQWDRYVSTEDQYLIGNWDGGQVFGVAGDKLAVRRGNCVLMDWNHNELHDFALCIGNGNSETQYASGDWDGDGRASLLVRRGNEYIVDANGDAFSDYSMAFGNHDDRMLVGDWDGDGDDNVAVVRGNVVYVDYEWDGLANTWFAYGNAGERMIAGDWNGNGVEDVAVVRPGVGILLNWNRGSGAADQVLQFGDYTDYVVVGDWNGDGRDEVGVMRGNCLLMDYNLSGGAAEKSYCYGNGAPTAVIQNY